MKADSESASKWCSGRRIRNILFCSVADPKYFTFSEAGCGESIVIDIPTSRLTNIITVWHFLCSKYPSSIATQMCSLFPTNFSSLFCYYLSFLKVVSDRDPKVTIWVVLQHCFVHTFFGHFFICYISAYVPAGGGWKTQQDQQGQEEVRNGNKRRIAA